MSDFEDRLAALDPAAGPSYQHRDLDTLISRITSQPVARKGRLWHQIELKLAGALIAGALVSAGSLALFQGGVALPVLALQSASGANAPKSPGSTASGAMQIYEKFNFIAGPGLSATTPTSLSYELQVPSSGANEASRVAAIFGVVGPVSTSGGSTDFAVTSASGASLDYANTGVPQWSYSASPSATSTDTTLGDLPSRSTFTSDVQRYLTKLGYGYTISAPSFGTTTSSVGAASTATSTEDVTYTVDVKGMSTDQSVNFSVDANNNVVSASGPAFSVGATFDYPLQSLAAGVSALNAAQQSRFPTPTTATGPPTTNAVGGASAPTAAPSGPPVVNVTLDADTLSLETYQLTDGTSWLLPVYNYTGTETSLNGSTSSATWNELAVDPRYVHVSGPGGPHGVINY